MAAELLAGLGIFKSMLDMAKGLKDINDAAIRNAAVIELQEKILSAQEQQSALVERVRGLEKEMARFEAWDAEKQKYELKQVHPGAFAYALKQDAQPPAPMHWLCATCYEQRKKSVLQYFGRAPGDGRAALYKCQNTGCGAFIRVHYTVNPGGGSGPD